MQHSDVRDSLTGLWTRSAFDADLTRRTHEGRCTLLLCDLDYLKLINDSFGHLAGDQALRDVTRALLDAKPEGWNVYRLGGDEFAVLCSDPVEQVVAWAQAVQARLDSLQERPLKLSMGAAAHTPPAPPLELFALADRYLYLAKRQGRGRVVATDEPQGHSAALPRLLERDEASAQAVAALQHALHAGSQSTLTIQSAPGLGLSAFLARVTLVAQSLGYQTLELSGDAYRACRQYGAWQGAKLNGVPASAPAPADLVASLNASRPLAIIADLPERFDPHTAAELGPLLERATILISGRGNSGPDTGPRPGQTVMTLPPLSARAIRRLIDHHPDGRLGAQASAWLVQRAAGSPAQLARWWAALHLEASLRHQTVDEMIGGELVGGAQAQRGGEGPADLGASASDPDTAGPAPAPHWEASLAQHLPVWPKLHLPYLHARMGQIQRGLELWRTHALLTVTGPEGRGTHRLALQLAAEQLASGWPHAAARLHLVSLAGIRSPEATLAHIMAALLGYPVAYADVPLLSRLLNRQPTLLMLDRPEPYALPARLLSELRQHSPDTRMIVTADAPLGAAEEAVLPLLPVTDAEVQTALLWELRRDTSHRQSNQDGPNSGGTNSSGTNSNSTPSDDSGPSPADLAALTEHVNGECPRLDGLLTTIRSFGLPAALEQMQRASGRGKAQYDFPELGPPERRVIAALSVLDGHFDLPWAGHVAEASPFLLSAMLDRRMVQPVSAGLMALSDGARRYGRVVGLRRWPAVRVRAEQRALAHAHELLTLHPPESGPWLRQVGQHYPMIRAALTGQLHGPALRHPQALEILTRLTPSAVAQGRFYDARDDLQAALRLPLDGIAPAQVLRLQLWQAQIWQQLGEHSRAQQLAERTQHNAGAGHPKAAAWASLIMARTLHRRSDYRRSRRLYAQCQQAAQTLSDPVMQVTASGGWARSSIYLGDLAAAWQAIQSTLAQAEALGRPLLLARTLNTAALVATEQRRLPEASAFFERALALQQQYGSPSEQILNLTGLGWVALLGGDLDRSVSLSRRVLRSAQDVGQSWEVGNALVNLGHAAARQGQWDSALHSHMEAARLAAHCDAPSVVAEALGGLADVLHRQNKSGEARTLLNVALHHPGANTEMTNFFAPLHHRLGHYPPTPLPDDLGKLLGELGLH
ncbi:diguanylate cyclase [Deinococcus sp. Arct2-2]|uniref:diguanylate cyclase domain-containing protein n=1 Tax=Deinococcus sp. Arct2-2 TaxID=2568653 RepID=UPI0010A432E1|nr:diguanylate cyclase [Deinococcus sp. Arct2-2]THF71489.1 diguanylate cyclase [Deinococcus sp. Arct2-2]